MIDRETFLRVLKGAPLSTLMALWFFGPQAQKQISRRTGFSRRTTRDALEYLQDLALVERSHYRGWFVSSGFFQLPFPQMEDLACGKPVDNIVKTVDNSQNGRSSLRRKGSLGSLSDAERDPGDPFQADHDHDDDHKERGVDNSNIVNRLRELGFSDAEQYFVRRDARLIGDWLAYYDALPAKRRNSFKNFGGLLRQRVDAGREAPRVSAAASCTSCGRVLINERCLVCDGVVKA